MVVPPEGGAGSGWWSALGQIELGVSKNRGTPKMDGL